MQDRLENLSVLIKKPQDIRVGIVQYAMKSERWSIRVGKRTIVATSSVALLPKQKVVVGRANDGWVVLDSSKLNASVVTSVKITG